MRREINTESELGSLDDQWSDSYGSPNGADRGAAQREIPKPPPLAEAAFHGVAGEFTRVVDPETEAAPAALLMQFLVASGAWLGRTGYYLAEADRHYSNLYSAIVGRTAKGRKGTSWGHVRRLLQVCEPEFKLAGGLSTGEGLIHAVRDERYEEKPIKERGRTIGYQNERVDAGVSDKRRLVIEPELSRVLKACQRDHNTLSAVMRQSWDTGDLKIMTKTSDETSTGAHVAIIGHITQQELNQLLTSIDVANGFANRFLWVWAERSKQLPFGGSLAEDAPSAVREKLPKAKNHAWQRERLKFDPEAAVLWKSRYGLLSSERPGLVGAILARAEAQVVRLSVVYALLDGAAVISLDHLRAALAVWEYSEASARYIFGDALGDETADTILSFLRSAGSAGATRTEISRLFGRHKSSVEIERALAALAKQGLARSERESTGGAPIERWRLTDAK